MAVTSLQSKVKVTGVSVLGVGYVFLMPLSVREMMYDLVGSG